MDDAPEAKPGANPYVGPRPFETGEPLFGRDRELAEITDLLGAERILLLHSPSGAGKSSLVQAGLIVRLRRRFDVWRPTRVGLPVDATAANRHVLSAVLGFEQGVPAALRRPVGELGRLALAEYVATRARRPGAPAEVLLIFDQFEEVLTVDPLAIAAKHEFFGQLGALLQSPQVWALFVLREDYLAPLDPYVQRVPTHLKNRYRIDRLGVEAARAAIVRPTHGLARQWREETVDRLVRDLATVKVQQGDGGFVEQVGQHVEPMQLQVVCRGLWDRLPAEDLSIDAEDLAAFGDVTHALGDYYAQAVGRIAGGNERAVRAWIGEKLISSEGVRTPVLRGPGSSEGLANAIVGALVDAHLVRADHRGGAVWFELAHDRLIKPVRVDNERWAQANLHAVQVQAALWARQGKPAALLLTEEGLAGAEAWATRRTLEEPDASFLAASRAARGQERALREAQAQALAAAQEISRRQRRNTRVVAALGVVALAAAVVAWRATWQAEHQQRQTELEKVRLRDATRITTAREAGRDAVTAAVLLREVDGTSAPGWLAGAVDLWNVGIPPVVLQHRGSVGVAVFSPDGKTVLTASEEPSVKLWPADGSDMPRVLQDDGAVRSAGFSRDGSRVLTLGRDGVARVFATSGGAPVVLRAEGRRIFAASLAPDGERVALAFERGGVEVWRADGAGAPVALAGGEEAALTVAFSPGGRLVAASTASEALVWAAAGGAPRRFEHGGKIEAVVVAPDEARVITVGHHARALVWPVEGGEPVTLRGHEDRVNAAAFSADGSRIVTTSADETARVWRADGQGEPVVLDHDPLAAGVVEVRSAAFSADGTRIVTAGFDDVARVWRADGTGAPVVLGGHPEALRSAVFSPDGSRVVTACNDGRARVFRADAPPQPRVLSAGDVVAAASFSTDGRRILTASWDDTATVWPVDGTGARVVLRGHTGDVVAAVFSPDGQSVLTVDTVARVWRADGTGEAVVLAEPGDAATVKHAAFSPDSQRVATARSDGSVQVWRWRERAVAAVLPARGGYAWQVGFTPDGGRVVVTADDYVVRVWSADGRGEPVELRGHTGSVRATRVAGDGTLVLTGAYDWTARLWPIGGGEARVFKGHTAGVVTVAFSQDGRVATASDDRTARVWRSDSFNAPIVLTGHTSNLTDVAFSPDGQQLLTAAADGTARVWWLDGSHERVVLRGHTGPVQSAAFSPYGRDILTASSDRTARVWRIPDRPEAMAYLWGATRFCLWPNERVDRLVEGSDEAMQRWEACRSRVAELAAEGAYR